MMDKLKKKKEFYSFSVLALAMILLVFVLVKIDLGRDVLDYTSHRSHNDEEQILYDFTSGMQVKQEFSNYCDFDFITLSFSDHDQVLAGEINIQIREVENGRKLIEKNIKASEVRYGVPLEISFEEVGGGKAEEMYEITMSSSNTGERAVGIFGYSADKDEKTAVINGINSKYALSIGIHSYAGLYKVITGIIMMIVSVSLLILILGIFVWNLKEEYLFLLIAVPFSVCMLMLWPGNSVYDEVRHNNTVYHYSNVLLGEAEEDNVHQIKMRKCDVIDKAEVDRFSTAMNAQAQKYWYDIDKAFEKAVDKSMVLVDISNETLVEDGSCLQYVPGIIGMTLGRMLGFNYFWMMTITRVFIAGFYLLISYLAIKIVPILKSMFVFWAALPMNLYQASGISYDSFTTAVGILVFAFIIRLWVEGLSRKDWICYAVAVFVLGQCKGGVYLTLLLLMCFIPKERFVDKKWVRIVGMLFVAGISMVSSFLPTIMSWFVKPVVSEAPPSVSEVINSGGAVAQKLHPYFVFEDPLGFFRMFADTMLENLDVYLGQMLGYRTAWANEPISLVVLLPFLIILLLAVVNKASEDFNITFLQKFGILAILGMEIIGMQMIFLIETPVYSDVIIGFQGRYFILFLPCILMLFRNENIYFRQKKEYLYIGFSMAQLIYWYFFLQKFMLA